MSADFIIIIELFAIADRDKDGRINMEELRDLHKQLVKLREATNG